jgi:hypothetical protein
MVTITLDNGAATQHADDQSGWFGFENLRRGQHHLRAEFEGYHPQTVMVPISRVETNYLQKSIVLTPLSEPDAAPEPVNIGTSYIPRYTKTGVPPPIDTRILFEYGPTGDNPTQARTGWVYLGSERETMFRELAVRRPSGGDRRLAREGIGKGLSKKGLEDRLVYAYTPIVVWSEAPERTFLKGFELGQPEAIAEAGSRLTITHRIREVGDGEVWAEVYIDEPL